MIDKKTLQAESAESLLSAMMGCSFELALVGEVEETEDMLDCEFASEKELREDMAAFVAEISRRLKNADPDMQDAIAAKAAWWKAVTKRFKLN